MRALYAFCGRMVLAFARKGRVVVAFESAGRPMSLVPTTKTMTSSFHTQASTWCLKTLALLYYLLYNASTQVYAWCLDILAVHKLPRVLRPLGLRLNSYKYRCRLCSIQLSLPTELLLSPSCSLIAGWATAGGAGVIRHHVSRRN